MNDQYTPLLDLALHVAVNPFMSMLLCCAGEAVRWYCCAVMCCTEMRWASSYHAWHWA
jgi:hypothetical protein